MIEGQSHVSGGWHFQSSVHQSDADLSGRYDRHFIGRMAVGCAGRSDYVLDGYLGGLIGAERRICLMTFAFGIFVVLHGLVHLLYFGQSARRFELKPGMTWPDGSWAFARLLGDEATRNLASILLILAAIGFVVGGVGVLASQAWWQPVVVGAAAFSSVVYLLFWNGRMQNLDGQGGIGILINLAILIVALVLR
jgi:hypothetical protein